VTALAAILFLAEGFLMLSKPRKEQTLAAFGMNLGPEV